MHLDYYQVYAGFDSGTGDYVGMFQVPYRHGKGGHYVHPGLWLVKTSHAVFEREYF